jgi:hypothetical protein
MDSFHGVPDRIRTYDLRLRKPTLYPAELRVHNGYFSNRGNPITNCQQLLVLNRRLLGQKHFDINLAECCIIDANGSIFTAAH